MQVDRLRRPVVRPVEGPREERPARGPVVDPAREGEAAKGPETTPAEWATALLEKLAESQKKPARKSAKKKKKDESNI